MQTLTWRQYKAGTWHALLPGALDALCGQVSTARPGMGPSHALPDPAGRLCRSCQAVLRRAVRRPLHVEGGRCACARCRAWRRHHALEFAATAAALPALCRCVREWSGAAQYVEAARAQIGAALLAWEMTDDIGAARDVEEAARVWRDAWLHAAAAYELHDGTHPLHAPVDEARGS